MSVLLGPTGRLVGHLARKHGFRRVLLVSGDRESGRLPRGRGRDHADLRREEPEEKVAIVAEETLRGRTLFIGNGINDAPALLAATVGVAFGGRAT
jgi:P-type E1-E2 ATPase